ncbi:MAG TPA: VOC family protein [Hansschlegelia sp.]
MEPLQETRPSIDGVVETAVYVDDLDCASAFYDALFGFPHLFADQTMVAYDAGRRSVFLLFRRGASAEAKHPPGGVIPGHDGAGPLHFAFATSADDIPRWLRRLEDHGVALEGRVDWPRGGVSLYFRDPDDNLVEIASPGLWASY